MLIRWLGLLAGSAIACCKSLNSLINLAIQSIRIAFRLGSRVASAGAQIKPKADHDQEWSTIVVGLGGEAAEAALTEFNETQVSDTNPKQRSLLTTLGFGTLK